MFDSHYEQTILIESDYGEYEMLSLLI